MTIQLPTGNRIAWSADGRGWFQPLKRGASDCDAPPKTSLFAIVANGFDRATLHRFDAKRCLLFVFGLRLHVRITALFGTREIVRRSFPTQVAVNALIIYVKLPADVFRVFVFDFGHNLSAS